MAPGGTSVDDAWQSFFETRAAEAVDDLLAAYPEQRSLAVDVIELHRHDPALVEALFDDPDPILRRGVDVLRSAHDALGRFNLRLANVPSQLALSGIRTRHAGTLVTAEGRVESVGPPQAAVAEAVLDCAACGGRFREPVYGLALSTPARCPDCAAGDAISLDLDGSTLVDVQRLDLVEADEGRSMALWVDDDLVGSVAAGERIRATGIVRLERRGAANRFDFYLSGLAVDEQRPGRPGATGEVPDRLKATIQSRWEDAIGG